MDLCNPGWSRIYNPPALTSHVLELYEYVIMPRPKYLLKDPAHYFASVVQPVTSTARAQSMVWIELILWLQA